jgi:hypothetical protein
MSIAEIGSADLTPGADNPSTIPQQRRRNVTAGVSLPALSYRIQLGAERVPAETFAQGFQQR